MTIKSKGNDITFEIPTPEFNSGWELTKLSLRTFLKSFWFILKVALPFYIPIEIIKHLLFPDTEKFIGPSLKFDTLMGGLFGTFVALSVVYGVAHFLESKAYPTVIEAYSFARKKWAHLFGLEFIGGWLMILGTLMLIVPGVFLMISYSLILPVFCFEGSNKQNWLGRSRELTLGNRKLILISAFFIILFIILSGFLSALVTELFSFSPTTYNILDISTDVFMDVLTFAFDVLSLLIYLKARNDRDKKPKEFWFLRWAR